MALSGLCTFVRSERMQTVRTLTAWMKISENIFKISENPNVSVKNRRYHQGKVLWNTNYMVKWAFSNILFFSSKYDIILSFFLFSCVKLLLNATIVHQDGQTPCQQGPKQMTWHHLIGWQPRLLLAGKLSVVWRLTARRQPSCRNFQL